MPTPALDQAIGTAQNKTLKLKESNKTEDVTIFPFHSPLHIFPTFSFPIFSEHSHHLCLLIQRCMSPISSTLLLHFSPIFQFSLFNPFIFNLFFPFYSFLPFQSIFSLLFLSSSPSIAFHGFFTWSDPERLHRGPAQTKAPRLATQPIWKLRPRTGKITF